jgi:hypothetical protein
MLSFWAGAESIRRLYPKYVGAARAGVSAGIATFAGH